MDDWRKFLTEITYARPQHFDFFMVWAFAFICLMLALAVKRWKRPAYARDSSQKLIGPDWVWVLSLILSCLMVVALAGPKVDKFKTVQSKDNIDIIFALDKSASMAIRDITPSRHEVMIKEVKNFVLSSAVRDGDRLTIFTFSEKSNWRMPLSQDRGEFLDKLSEIEQPEDRVYHDGSQLFTYFSGLLTHIPKALEQQNNFSKQTSYPRIVFMFSDGDNFDDSLNTSLADLVKKNIKVYTVGVGTEQGGTITVKTPSEINVSEKKIGQLEPTVIRSKLNMRVLNLIKEKTGSKSYVMSSSSSQVQGFMSVVVAENRKPTLTLVQTGEAENFWWHLLFVPAFIIVSMITIRFIMQ